VIKNFNIVGISLTNDRVTNRKTMFNPKFSVPVYQYVVQFEDDKELLVEFIEEMVQKFLELGPDIIDRLSVIK
jgi:phosphoribosylaminoimidazole carboxylase (NCAIR synthetase)